MSSMYAPGPLAQYSATQRTSAQSLRCLGPLPVETRVETSLAIAQSNLRLRSMLPDRYNEPVFLRETMAHVSHCLSNMKSYTFASTLESYQNIVFKIFA
jgi:hypothetical protein